MIPNRFQSRIWITIGLIVPTILFFTALSSIAADVTLAWDANDPAPEGYRVFVREGGTNYTYAYPIWESDNYDQTTECTLVGLTEGTTYYFVVRAYDGDLESADSEEVTYTPPTEDANQESPPSEEVNDTPANEDVNQAPVAEAGSNRSVYEEAAVTLTGTASSDADGSIASYLWKQTGGTAVALTNAAMARASFTAPVVDLSGETLTFSLTVTDDDGETDTDTVTVSVLKSSINDDTNSGISDTPTADDANTENEDSEQVNDTPANDDANPENEDSEQANDTPLNGDANQAPVAKAGSNRTVYEKAAVTLTGTASSDADGSIAAYLWEQTGGTAVALSKATTANASFTAPIVGLSGETLFFGEALTFRLTVTDDDGETDADTVTISVLKSSETDVDGDAVPDVNDLFPDDPAEWADNDADGIGDNADTDDDNDGMSDTWEETYGLDPLVDDAGLDADGDGVSNLDEYTAGSDPIAVPGNTVPDTPVIEDVSPTETVSLTPVLVTAAYFDADNDDHFKSQWQIGTGYDFTTLILDKTSKVQLTDYEVGKMVLEVDTVYYWRVRFIDTNNGVSEWSETATFTTIAAEASGDKDSDGIPDDQEVMDITTDVNEDGVADSLEGDIRCLNTVDGQTMIGVEPVSEGGTLVSVESIASDTIPDQSVQPGFGLIGFRLYLADGVTTATVKISFDKQVPDDSQLYKYTKENGWQIYSNAVFAANRKSVTLMLEDGGQGDEDGVVNGVIVDPSGIAYTETTVSAAVSTADSSSGGGGGGGGCFITVMDPSDDKTKERRLSLWSQIAQSASRLWKSTLWMTAK